MDAPRRRRPALAVRHRGGVLQDGVARLDQRRVLVRRSHGNAQGVAELLGAAQRWLDERNGVLVFTDGQKSSGPQTTVTSGEVLYDYGSLLAFDPVKRETAFMATTSVLPEP